MKLLLRTALLAALGVAGIYADVTFQEKTKITGGSLMEVLQKIVNNPNLPPAVGSQMKHTLEDQNFDVYIMGNRMARIGPHQSSIYDLDAGTLTTINHDNQTYAVMTFDELSQRMQQMQQRLGKAQADLQFDAKVDKTGESRKIDGETANETVITLRAKQANNGQDQMVVSTHTWLVPMNAPRQEARNFQKRMGEKAAAAFMGGAAPLMGFASSGLSAVMREMSRLDGGYPALSTTSLTGSLGPGNPLTALAAMSGAGGSTGPNAPLLTTESSFHNFVQGVADPAKFAIPAGYKALKLPASAP
jgi:hypothetical protein